MTRTLVLRGSLLAIAQPASVAAKLKWSIRNLRSVPR
jgi:hypothetical protein